MITGLSMVLETGTGTLEFPVDQIEQIVPLADLPVLPAEFKLPAVAGAQSVESSEQMLMKAAIQQGLEPGFVQSVARVESGLRQNAVSPKGALGLMQLMPMTASQLGVDPTLAAQNAEGGAKFLRQLLLKYNGDAVLALAAYNAGPGAVDKFKGVPPYQETRRYVVKVLEEYARRQKAEKSVTEPSASASGSH
jgi:soluble lytic murein transglycosylase-like protein